MESLCTIAQPALDSLRHARLLSAEEWLVPQILIAREGSRPAHLVFAATVRFALVVRMNYP